MAESLENVFAKNLFSKDAGYVICRRSQML